MAKLTVNDEGVKVRYQITPTIAAWHGSVKSIRMNCQLTSSSGRTCVCPCDLAVSGSLSSLIVSEVKAAVSAEAAKKGVSVTPLAYDAELWMADDHKEIEVEAFAYPTISVPADGPIPGGEEKMIVKFAPSSELRSALKSECDSKVSMMLV